MAPSTAAQHAACVLAACAYSWWAVGVRPFTGAAYVAVGLPVFAVVLAMVRTKPSSDELRSRPSIPVRAVVPWLVVLVAAVVLECVGLALGGRSATVPTLSTVIDRALVTRAARFALFAAWLAAGVVPVVSSWRARAASSR